MWRMFNIRHNQYWALAPLLAPLRHRAATPLTRTKKGGACRDGANVTNKGAVAVAQKKSGANSRHFRTKFSIKIS